MDKYIIKVYNKYEELTRQHFRTELEEVFLDEENIFDFMDWYIWERIFLYEDTTQGFLIWVNNKFNIDISLEELKSLMRYFRDQEEEADDITKVIVSRAFEELENTRFIYVKDNYLYIYPYFLRARKSDSINFLNVNNLYNLAKGCYGNPFLFLNVSQAIYISHCPEARGLKYGIEGAGAKGLNNIRKNRHKNNGARRDKYNYIRNLGYDRHTARKYQARSWDRIIEELGGGK